MDTCLLGCIWFEDKAQIKLGNAFILVKQIFEIRNKGGIFMLLKPAYT